MTILNRKIQINLTENRGLKRLYRSPHLRTIPLKSPDRSSISTSDVVAVGAGLPFVEPDRGGVAGVVRFVMGLSDDDFSRKFREHLDIVGAVMYNEVMSKTLLLHAHHILTDNEGPVEILLRRIAKMIGIDPWGIELQDTIMRASEHEQEPVSRFVWGSPCRFVRTIDIMVHVILPAMLEEGHPTWATYLRTTSPRWGRTWRHW